MLRLQVLNTHESLLVLPTDGELAMGKSRRVFRSFTFALAIVASGAVSSTVIAQDKKQEESSGNVLLPVTGDTFGSLGAIYGSTYGVVKDAPFSAEMVFERVQTLHDGNRIVTRSSTVMYRDSQGRTRNEHSFKFPHLIGGKNIEHKTISIFDPVGGVSYTLDPQTRTAYKYMLPSPPRSSDVVPIISYSEGARFKTVVSSLGKQLGLNVVYDDSVKDRQQINDPIELENVTMAKTMDIILRTYKCSFEQIDGRTIRIYAENPAKSPGSESFESFYANMAPSLKASPMLPMLDRSESLGKQRIGEIEAEGTRITQAIPAGAMGNERPIEVLHERWYSRELQIDLMTKWINPRLGESTQRLTNLIRSEPDASLFQLPSDYTTR
jgi:hypothetical protein